MTNRIKILHILDETHIVIGIKPYGLGSRIRDMGTFIKDVRFFLQFSEIPTYLCPIGYVLSTYVLCPIFHDIPTYPKIGHPLWTFPNREQYKKKYNLNFLSFFGMKLFLFSLTSQISKMYATWYFTSIQANKYVREFFPKNGSILQLLLILHCT